MEIYATKSPGIGGKIRQFPEDFVVEEILVDGSKAEVSPAETHEIAGEGPYLICVLVKRNWDTLLAVKKVTRRLGIGRKRLQIAGMKDAKALTAQHISISGVPPERVLQVKIKDITLRPLYFSRRRIFSQLLLGNQFQVVVRAVSHSSSVIERRIKDLQDELSSLGGVPNFYGHQRFGTIRPITHVVGRFLAQGDLEKAALTFLAQPSPHEHPESMGARKQLQDTQNFEDALRFFPRHLGYERLMLSHLAKQPKDFVGAFRKLPLKLRKLFVQAYQSFLFNKFLSERIRRGIPINEAQIGDYLVNLDSHGLPTSGFTQVTAQSLQTAKKALKEDKMRVAIPLIGFKQYPSQGVQGEIEREILEIEKVEPQNFYVSFMPEVSAPGELRTILAPTINLSIEGPSKDSVNPSKRGVKLGFTLHRGSYATVVLREFMKPLDIIKAGF
jgi:tRNA pseudouridine13 synthase